MKFRIFFLVFLSFHVTTEVFTQTELVTVTAVQANLRGTPNMKGIVVSTVSKGQSFELIKNQADWFLVQTPDYVGWLHKTVAEIDLTEADIVDLAGLKTIKTVTRDTVPFTREYVGPDYPPTIFVENNTKKTVTLNFIGKQYRIVGNGAEAITVAPGEYEFSASAPGVSPLHGSHRFEQGYRYTWTFFIAR